MVASPFQRAVLVLTLDEFSMRYSTMVMKVCADDITCRLKLMIWSRFSRGKTVDALVLARAMQGSTSTGRVLGGVVAHGPFEENCSVLGAAGRGGRGGEVVALGVDTAG